MVSPMLAAKAYAAAAQQAVVPTGPAAGGEVAGINFGQVLQQAMQQTVQASHNAETKMAAHVQGKAELVDVVTAVASAEASLETAMAVRDQVISAYQEIMRMPI